MKQETPMKRRLRYQRRYTELVRQAVQKKGVDPASASEIARKALADEWLSEFPDTALPAWEPFGGATS